MTPDAPAGRGQGLAEGQDAGRPPKTRIIHNDYRFDNVILNPDNPMEIIGVLDWK